MNPSGTGAVVTPKAAYLRGSPIRCRGGSQEGGRCGSARGHDCTGWFAKSVSFSSGWRRRRRLELSGLGSLKGTRPATRLYRIVLLAPCGGRYGSMLGSEGQMSRARRDTGSPWSVAEAQRHLLPFGTTTALQSVSIPSGSPWRRSSVSAYERRFLAHALKRGFGPFLRLCFAPAPTPWSGADAL